MKDMSRIVRVRKIWEKQARAQLGEANGELGRAELAGLHGPGKGVRDFDDNGPFFQFGTNLPEGLWQVRETGIAGLVSRASGEDPVQRLLGF